MISESRGVRPGPGICRWALLPASLPGARPTGGQPRRRWRQTQTGWSVTGGSPMADTIASWSRAQCDFAPRPDAALASAGRPVPPPRDTRCCQRRPDLSEQLSLSLSAGSAQRRSANCLINHHPRCLPRHLLSQPLPPSSTGQAGSPLSTFCIHDLPNPTLMGKEAARGRGSAPGMHPGPG